MEGVDKMSSTDWEKLKDNLEPASRNYYFNPNTDIQLSIAISLKRIADNMDSFVTEFREFNQS